MFEKLVSFTKKVADLSDRPSLNPSELKAQFDAAPDEVRVNLNKLIDALKKTEAGDSGAKNIGMTTITGLTGTDVQTLLESLKTYIDKPPAEIDASLQNGWQNAYGDQKARYWKDVFGMVHVNGRIKLGTRTDGTTVFTLPAGYRPKDQYYENKRGLDVIILSTGEVKIYNCVSNADNGIDNIQFRAYN
ncbi:hypothetical protein J1P26_07450 [Neobacillus sp. MM2021_6]|uniref:hypothetical protein n=1 Tax=Bacillaceae TaxID=186817 RepID=UPI0014080D04|nr:MULTISPECIES: hypothetical protein [Bacillaceae]MBO0959568.1 hypothetical protein [Neobacillus sp. MM2021_6]NHC17134.1 hypothetical protein [Bacillus sp. MM2020_4]